MMMFAAATTQEPSRGWGGPIAILVAVAVFIAFATIYDWAQSRRPHSPTRRGPRAGGVNTQVRSVSDTADTTADIGGWWGRIIDVGGRRIRQIEADHRPADDEIDLALDDEEGAETLEQFIARSDDEDVPYAEIVRDAMRHYRVSESTAKRRIRDVRAERQDRGAA